MSLTGYCTDATCLEGLTKLYECNCCGQFVCSQHRSVHFMADMTKKADKMVHDFITVSQEFIPEIVKKNQESQHGQQSIEQTIPLNREEATIINVESSLSGITNSSVIDNEIMDNEALMADINPPIRSTPSASKFTLEIYIQCLVLYPWQRQRRRILG
ncbi:unnamed protein product [Adineta steineri]|uniref:Uncharacterized protein n=1 Tax=Adineta steineri TaxID=433720 RepID=A0A814IWU5_9BILA|nr:unnamed protein product [Adineta steineri]CAF1031556.1 unnamed protein product [Adineta steineri]